MSVTVPQGVTVKSGNKKYVAGDKLPDDIAKKAGLSTTSSSASKTDTAKETK